MVDLNCKKNGETDLWAAVILQAFEDIIDIKSNASLNVKDREKAKARAWFINNGPDFKQVCFMANINPDKVREEAIKRIEMADNSISTKIKIPYVVVEHNGQQITLRELSKSSGVKLPTLIERYQKGLKGDALTNPTINGSLKKLYTYNGQSLTMIEWSKITGIKRCTISARLNSGWSIEKALTVTIRQTNQEREERRLNIFNSSIKAQKAKADKQAMGGRSRLSNERRDRRGESRSLDSRFENSES